MSNRSGRTYLRPPCSYYATLPLELYDVYLVSVLISVVCTVRADNPSIDAAHCAYCGLRIQILLHFTNLKICNHLIAMLWLSEGKNVPTRTRQKAFSLCSKSSKTRAKFLVGLLTGHITLNRQCVKSHTR